MVESARLPSGTSLARAEETIALVPRATPLDVHAEIRRLTSAAARGQRLRPRFRYAPPPELGGVRRSLERVARETAPYGRPGALLARRAEELELEARLAERVGAPGFAELAAERFRAPRGGLEERVAEFVNAALSRGVPGPGAGARLIASDDRGSTASLLFKLVRGAAELALPIRVEVRPEQLAIAATGHGLVAIRPGVLLPAGVAARIALHELLAHALAARAECAFVVHAASRRHGRLCGVRRGARVTRRGARRDTWTARGVASSPCVTSPRLPCSAAPTSTKRCASSSVGARTRARRLKSPFASTAAGASLARLFTYPPTTRSAGPSRASPSSSAGSSGAGWDSKRRVSFARSARSSAHGRVMRRTR